MQIKLHYRQNLTHYKYLINAQPLLAVITYPTNSTTQL